MGIPMHFAVLFDFQSRSAHIGEALHGFCEVFDGFICVAVLDAVAHDVLDVPLKYDLAAAVQSGFCGKWLTDLKAG